MFDLQVNYVALIVAAIAVFALGWLWYGPLFSKVWLHEMKLSQTSMNSDKSNMGKFYLVMYVTNLVTAYVLAHILQFTDVANNSEAIVTAFWVWLGFYAAGGVHHYLFPAKSLKLYLLDNAYQLVSLIIVALILTNWA